jgi:hypothetical protein
MELWNRLKVWWRGVPTSYTETEGGGWRIEYQHPDHPPARARVVAAASRPVVKGIGGVLLAIAVGVVIAAQQLAGAVA